MEARADVLLLCQELLPALESRRFKISGISKTIFLREVASDARNNLAVAFNSLVDLRARAHRCAYHQTHLVSISLLQCANDAGQRMDGPPAYIATIFPAHFEIPEARKESFFCIKAHIDHQIEFAMQYF